MMTQSPFAEWRAALAAALILAGLSFSGAAAQAPANPNVLPDGSPIELKGTVVSTMREGFMLDYGTGIIKVELDDFDWEDEAADVNVGEEVEVIGQVDASLVQARAIEAATVVIRARNKVIEADVADEETAYLAIRTDGRLSTDLDASRASVVGTVAEVRDNAFILNVKGTFVPVTIQAMAYNPLDDEGYQRVRPGDLVKVTGLLDGTLFRTQIFIAVAILKLNAPTDTSADVAQTAP